MAIGRLGNAARQEPASIARAQLHETILITGSTDGLGLESARRLAALGHDVLLHGRRADALEHAVQSVGGIPGAGRVGGFLADLSRFADVVALGDVVLREQPRLDVLINNAGAFRVPEPATPDGLDVRFMVNAIAPYMLARRLAPHLGAHGRVVNLSSAAQSAVEPTALRAEVGLSDFEAYGQSKLALTMWSRELGLEFGDDGPSIVAVNPGSMLGTKMVREGFGVAGREIGVGAEVVLRAAVSDTFAERSGEYFDGDSGRFAPPHPDALDPAKTRELVALIDATVADLGIGSTPGGDGG